MVSTGGRPKPGGSYWRPKRRAIARPAPRMIATVLCQNITAMPAIAAMADDRGRTVSGPTYMQSLRERTASGTAGRWRKNGAPCCPPRTNDLEGSDCGRHATDLRDAARCSHHPQVLAVPGGGNTLARRVRPLPVHP